MEIRKCVIHSACCSFFFLFHMSVEVAVLKCRPGHVHTHCSNNVACHMWPRSDLNYGHWVIRSQMHSDQVAVDGWWFQENCLLWSWCSKKKGYNVYRHCYIPFFFWNMTRFRIWNVLCTWHVLFGYSELGVIVCAHVAFVHYTAHSELVFQQGFLPKFQALSSN